MSNNIQITEFEKLDTKAVVSFFKEIYDEMDWDMHPAQGLDNPHKYFYSRKGILLVAKNNNQIIGTSGIVSLDVSHCLLKTLYVATDYRGKGLATELLNASIIRARKMQFHYLLLDVDRDNPRAKHFYKKNGFIHIPQPAYEGWWESLHPESFYYFKLEL